MPERLDRVVVAGRYGPVEISWEARDALLHEIRHLESGKPVVKAFEDAGASRPVALDAEGKALVVEAIHVMGSNAGGLDQLAGGLFELRNAFVDELTAPSSTE